MCMDVCCFHISEQKLINFLHTLAVLFAHSKRNGTEQNAKVWMNEHTHSQPALNAKSVASTTRAWNLTMDISQFSSLRLHTCLHAFHFHYMYIFSLRKL